MIGVMSRLRAPRFWVLFDVHRRRHPAMVLLAVTVCEITFLYLVRQLGPPRKFVGIPGAGAVVIALVAATLEGPLVGAVAVAIAGVVFTAITANFGRDVELATVAYSVLLWLVATVAAGMTADQARGQIRERERDLSRALSSAESSRDAIRQLLELGPVFFSAADGARLEERICEAATTTFRAAVAVLLGHHDDKLEVQATSGLPAGTSPSVVGSGGTGAVEQPTGSFVVFWPGDDPGPAWLSELVRPLGMRAASIIPIGTEEHPSRILVLGWKTYRAVPLPEEDALFRRFADQAALAIGRAEVDRLHAQLEARLLPRLPILHPTLLVESYYLPGEQLLGLGGDFFDFLPVRDTGAAFLIGDVSGHDVESAAVAAALRATWRALVLAGETLEGTMRTMARVLQLERPDTGLYATVLAGIVSPTGDELTLVSFGHPSPILFASDARLIPLTPALPLGFWEGDPWTATTLLLPPVWTLFLYTDGLVEGFAAPNTRTRFGIDRLLQTLSETRIHARTEDDVRTTANERPVTQDTHIAVTALIDVVVAANGAPLPDDVAILVLQSDPRNTGKDQPGFATSETLPTEDGAWRRGRSSGATK